MSLSQAEASTRGPVVWAYLRCSSLRQDEQRQLPGILSYHADNLPIFEGLPLSPDLVISDHGRSAALYGWRRRGLGKIVNQSSPGDHLIVSTVSRLGRRLPDVMDFTTVCNQKQIAVHTVEEDLLLLPETSKIYCTNSLWVEWSKWKLKESVTKAEAWTQKVGRRVDAGRLSIDPHYLALHSQRALILRRIKDGISQADIAGELGVNPKSLHLFIHRNHLVVEAGLPEPKPRPKKLFGPQRARIVEMLRQGIPRSDIARQLDVPVTTLSMIMRLHNLLEEAGLPKRRNGPRKIRAPQMDFIVQQLRLGTLTRKEIAAELGVPPSALTSCISKNRLWEKAGLPQPGHGPAKKLKPHKIPVAEDSEMEV